MTAGSHSTGNGAGEHAPVMVDEVVGALEPRDGAVYVDGTFGGGGYTRALLEAADCAVLAIDRDPVAVAAGSALIAHYGDRLTVIQGRFSDMAAHVAQAGHNKVDGVALDVGVSSMQIDEADRGFSFSHDGPLDMRMGQAGHSAADAVNTLSEKSLAWLIFVYGEDRRARAIARAIVAAREDKPIETTRELADLVARVVGRSQGKARLHPATRTFQALRIYVNDELNELARGLFGAEEILRAGGRLAVVCFHSLEDRIAKTFFRDRSGLGASGSRHAPPEALQQQAPSFGLLFRGARKPSDQEIARNPRARSARLRAAERTQAPAWPIDLTALGVPQEAA